MCTCTYPCTHSGTRIHSDSPSLHIAEAICYFSCCVHSVSNDSKTDAKYGRMHVPRMHMFACMCHTHTCAFPERFPCSMLPLRNAHTFSCCLMSVLTADQLLCTYIFASCICLHIMLPLHLYIIHACDVGIHIHLDAMHAC